MKKIVGVTACPTGIAHTYMAAEMLEKAGKKQGVKVIIETNGSIGVENRLKQKDIDEAVAVVIAADTKVEKARFNGKPMLEVSVSKGIKKADEIIKDALEGKFSTYQHGE